MQKIKVFAAFKEYFPEEFDLPGETGTVAGLRAALLVMNSEAAGLLGTARFAIDHEIIGDDRKILSQETVYLIPPSGGG